MITTLTFFPLSPLFFRTGARIAASASCLVPKNSISRFTGTPAICGLEWKIGTNADKRRVLCNSTAQAGHRLPHLLLIGTMEDQRDVQCGNGLRRFFDDFECLLVIAIRIFELFQNPFRRQRSDVELCGAVFLLRT